MGPLEPCVVTPRSALGQNSPARYKLPAGDVNAELWAAVVGGSVAGLWVAGAWVTGPAGTWVRGTVVVVAAVVVATDSVVVGATCTADDLPQPMAATATNANTANFCLLTTMPL
jgi:hypothetical protein